MCFLPGGGFTCALTCVRRCAGNRETQSAREFIPMRFGDKRLEANTTTVNKTGREKIVEVKKRFQAAEDGRMARLEEVMRNCNQAWLLYIVQNS